jgi:hypothetical protein
MGNSEQLGLMMETSVQNLFVMETRCWLLSCLVIPCYLDFYSNELMYRKLKGHCA